MKVSLIVGVEHLQGRGLQLRLVESKQDAEFFEIHLEPVAVAQGATDGRPPYIDWDAERLKSQTRPRDRIYALYAGDWPTPEDRERARKRAQEAAGALGEDPGVVMDREREALRQRQAEAYCKLESRLCHVGATIEARGMFPNDGFHTSETYGEKALRWIEKLLRVSDHEI